MIEQKSRDWTHVPSLSDATVASTQILEFYKLNSNDVFSPMRFACSVNGSTFCVDMTVASLVASFSA